MVQIIIYWTANCDNQSICIPLNTIKLSRYIYIYTNLAQKIQLLTIYDDELDWINFARNKAN